MSFHRQPLDLSTFPPQLQNNLRPEAPPPLKMMAARGMLPVPPAIGVRALYQLQFDPDESVQQEAAGSLLRMPSNILGPALQQEQPPGLLDWVAEVHAATDPVVEAVILNANTDDLTLVSLAATANASICDLVANNQMRILRTPAILENLYKNPNARMATIDKLIDLAQRNGVSLAGIPGLQQALDQGMTVETSTQESFEELLQEEAAKLEAEEEEVAAREAARDSASRIERARMDKEDEEEQERVPANLHGRIQQMSISQKVRLATVGSREAIKILVNDPNRLIHMAAIQSPRLQPGDIRKMSSNKSLPDNVIAYIARNREWVRHYDIMLNLALNPKTPLPEAMRFLNHLRTNDLRSISRSRNVPGQLSRSAKQLISKRGGG